jgi:hypothetical protein
VTNNYVLAGPDSADPITGDPTFRQLTTRDLPADISIDTMGTVTWDSVDKTGSSLGDLNVRSASDLSSGTLPDARFPATLPFLSGENLYSLNAMRLTIGVIPWAAFPAILPTVSGINLINLNASNISSGVVPCSYTHALNGDVISVGCDAQLAVTGVTAGTYGDATHSVTVVVDAKGRITAISENVISGFGTVDLATDVGSSILGVANGGTGMDASAAANGTLLIGNGTGFTLTTLTGTANQVGVSNASGVITLFTPQAINSTATPQFARLGLGTGAGATALITAPGQINTGYFDAGNAGVALAISWNNGMTQKVNMDANTVFTFNNPIAGVPEYRLDLVQTSGGSHTATWPGTIVWQGGMAPTLTTTAAATDICTFRWNGTAYLGDCALDFE